MEPLSATDGLTIEYNEEEATLTISWDENTHPQWNFLKETNGESILEGIREKAEEVIGEHENKEQ